MSANREGFQGLMLFMAIVLGVLALLVLPAGFALGKAYPSSMIWLIVALLMHSALHFWLKQKRARSQVSGSAVHWDVIVGMFLALAALGAGLGSAFS